MTALPSWLVDVLDRGLPMLRGRERDELAEMIVMALPKEVIAETIKSSVSAVLKTRGIADGAGDLAREIGNNAGGSVLLMLQVGEDEDDECASFSCGVCLDGLATCPIVDPPGQTQWTCLACGRFVGEARRGA